MGAFVDYEPNDDCVNWHSYGELCNHCNACGRINPDTKKEDALHLYKELLQECVNFNNWFEDEETREFQQKNNQESINEYQKRINELENS